MKIKIRFLGMLIRIILPALFIATPIFFFSQDGEKLFKTNCASCHNPVKNSTGPKLQGAKQKWIDGGEGELIYKWVNNPTDLYNSGSVMAEKIWNFSPTAMKIPGELSNDQIDAIFKYVDAYTAPVADLGGADGIANSGQKKGSSTYWWWIIAILLLIVIFTTAGTRRQLSHLNAEKEGEEASDPSIAESAKAWILRNWLTFVFLFVVVLLIGGVDLFNRLYQVGIFEDYQPTQPIAYSHKLHAGDMGIDCKYCHHSAEKSKHAGIPTANVCMNCHKTVVEGKEHGTVEIDKIHAAVGYDKETKTYKEKDGNRVETPIIWNKAHNLPDHVFFSHAQHVHPNTGNIDCRQCHGHVETYTLGRVSTTEEINEYAETDEGISKGIIKLERPLLTMGWCIECHNKKKIDLTKSGYYEEMHKRLKNRPDFMRALDIKNNKLTVRQLGGWECAKCHY